MRGHVGPKRAVTMPKRLVTLVRNTQSRRGLLAVPQAQAAPELIEFKATHEQDSRSDQRLPPLGPQPPDACAFRKATTLSIVDFASSIPMDYVIERV